MTTTAFAEARKVATEFNRTHGAELLRVVAPAPEQVTFAELRALASTKPGDYLAANAFEAIKGRRPTHAECIKIGQLLGMLMVARKKHGPSTFWRLDKAFADRSH